MKKNLVLLLLLVSNLIAFGKVEQPALWECELSDTDPEIGDTISLVFNVKIDQGWHLYSTDFDPELGPTVTTFNFESSSSFDLVGKITPIGAKRKYDEIWEGEVSYFKKKAKFVQKILVKETPVLVKGTYDYQVCSEMQCISFDDEFSKKTSGSVKKTSTEAMKKVAKAEEEVLDTKKEEKSSSLWAVIIEAILWGFAALLTPCVFPMVPMTVSFFMKGGENKAKGRFMASIYGISIVALYTLPIAILIGATYFLGGDSITADIFNWLSTHWLPNLLFFLIFMIFAASFFGAFEIVLPSKLVNKADSKADKGGLLGTFFMALTLVLVSFSCTGPIVGSIIVKSTQGEVWEPIITMMAFSIAFALPFTLFAFFPGWLKNLPKSGGWLNSVKVVLGFIELALGLKFLSVADQTYHWGLLDREVYLALWIIAFTLLGFYLLGKLQFSHDTKNEKVGVPRLFLAWITFAFVIYLLPGMIGAPLKALAGYLPPQASHDFDLISVIRENQSTAVGTTTKKTKKAKYSDFLHLPHGIHGYFDYQEALKAAKEQNKPLFIDFTGHGCVNCREMEARVWADPAVLQKIKEDYIVLALYVDDKTELPESEWYTSDYDGKLKKTIGKQNADLQIKRYNMNAQPYYVLLDHNEKLLVEPKSYDLNVNSFVNFLNKGVNKFNKI
ncbi:MAG: thioredoxin family protein [Bacteroidales bacterium]|nr:thioredoxin family protein [Bacteroidales bacterium]